MSYFHYTPTSLVLVKRKRGVIGTIPALTNFDFVISELTQQPQLIDHVMSRHDNCHSHNFLNLVPFLSFHVIWLSYLSLMNSGLFSITADIPTDKDVPPSNKHFDAILGVTSTHQALYLPHPS